MRRMISKMCIYGLFASLLYVAATVGIIFYALFCEGVFCSALIVVPVLPEVFLFKGLVGGSALMYGVFVLLNTVVVYGIVYYVVRHVLRRKEEE